MPFWLVLAEHNLNINQECITLSGLLTRFQYPSIRLALDQVNSRFSSSQTNIEFVLNETEGITHVCLSLFNEYTHKSF